MYGYSKVGCYPSPDALLARLDFCTMRQCSLIARGDRINRGARDRGGGIRVDEDNEDLQQAKVQRGMSFFCAWERGKEGESRGVRVAIIFTCKLGHGSKES